MSPGRRIHWIALAIIAVGAALRLAGLGIHSLWLDEATSLQFANHATLGCLQAEVNNPPLFRLLLHGWVRLVGDGSDAALRLLPALFGIAALALFWPLARRMLDDPAALFALALFALDPFHLLFSQEIRAYSLFILFTIAGLLLHLVTLERGHAWPAAVGLGLVLLGGLHTHYFFGWLLLVVLGHRALVIRRRPRTDRPGALALFAPLIAAGALFLPWTWYFLSRFEPQDRSYTKRLFGQMIALPFMLLVGNSGAVRVYPESYPKAALRHLWMIVPFVVAFAPAAVLGVRRLWRESEGRPVLALVALPIFGLALFFWALPLFTSRYLSFLIPAACLIAAAGTMALPRRTLIAIVGGALITLQLISLGRYHFDDSYGRENWRGAAAWVQERQRPGDQIVFDKFYVHIPFDHYHRGHVRKLQVPLDRAGRMRILNQVVNNASGRVFVVQSHVWDIGDWTARTLRKRLCQRDHRVFRQHNGIEIHVFERCRH